MSEEKRSFMEELDLWTETIVINPLHEAVVEGDGDNCDAVSEDVKKAIRQKVLDSYKNGLKAAGPAKPRGAYKPRGK